MGVAPAIPVIWGGIKAAGQWLVKQAGKEVVKTAAKEAGKAAIGAAISKGVDELTSDSDEQQPQAFDEKAASKKAAFQAAQGARRRIAQQTQTLLTSPLGGIGGVGRAVGAAKTLLGM